MFLRIYFPLEGAVTVSRNTNVWSGVVCMASNLFLIEGASGWRSYITKKFFSKKCALNYFVQYLVIQNHQKILAEIVVVVLLHIIMGRSVSDEFYEGQTKLVVVQNMIEENRHATPRDRGSLRHIQEYNIFDFAWTFRCQKDLFLMDSA